MNQEKVATKGFLHSAVLTVCALALSVSYIPNASAQWRWVDDLGTTHMSDQPPPASVPDDKILSRPAVTQNAIQLLGTKTIGTPDQRAQPDPNVAAGLQSEDDAQKAATQTAEEEARKQEEQARRMQACESAKKQLQRYSTGVRIRDIDEKGEYYYLSDKELAARKQSAEAAQKEYCSQ